MGGSATHSVRGYTKARARQRRAETGCIPTACEWLVRFHGIDGPAVDEIQDICDLDKGKVRGRDRLENNFRSVSERVASHLAGRAPTFRVEGDSTPMTGSEKIARIETLISEDTPCVIPFSGPLGFHALAVVGDDRAAGEFVVLLMRGSAPDDEMRVPKTRIRVQQDLRAGGQDVLFVQRGGPAAAGGSV